MPDMATNVAPANSSMARSKISTGTNCSFRSADRDRSHSARALAEEAAAASRSWFKE